MYKLILKNTVWNRWLEQYICCLQQNTQSLKYKANAEGGKEWKIYFIVAVPPWTQQLNTKNDRMTRCGLNFTVAANKVDLSLAERRPEKENDNFYCVAKKSE